MDLKKDFKWAWRIQILIGLGERTSSNLRVYSSILFIIQSYLKSNCFFLIPKGKHTYKYLKPKYFIHTNFLSPPSYSRKLYHLSSFSPSRFSSSFFFLLFQEILSSSPRNTTTPQHHHHHRHAAIAPPPLFFFLCWFNLITFFLPQVLI